MAKKLKKIIGSLITNLLTKWLEDFFIAFGVGIIVYTTYEKFGVTTGNYTLGALCLLFGFLLAKK